MDKKLPVVIIVVMLLNVTITVVGFGSLQNEIKQLKTEEPESPVTPTPTEPEPVPEPETEPEPEPTPEPQHEPEQTPETDATLQEPVEPEPTEPKSTLKAPEAELTGEDARDKSRMYDSLKVKVEGLITNPNSVRIYKVSINLYLRLKDTGFFINVYTAERTITVGTMEANEVLQINKLLTFRGRDADAIFKSLSYKVYWSETEQ